MASKTVYDYYAKWEADGTTEAIHDAVRGRVRTAASRVEQPSAVAVDAQSVKTYPSGEHVKDAVRDVTDND
jgi:hypothetical protein